MNLQPAWIPSDYDIVYNKVKLLKTVLTSSLSLCVHLTSLTAFFSNVFERMITMVTRSYAPDWSNRRKGQGRPS